MNLTYKWLPRPFVLTASQIKVFVNLVVPILDWRLLDLYFLSGNPLLLEVVSAPTQV